jgi:hypothetical protein
MVDGSRRRTRKMSTMGAWTYLINGGLVSQGYSTPQWNRPRAREKSLQRRVRVERVLVDQCASLCLARDCQDSVRARHSRFNFVRSANRDITNLDAPNTSTHRACPNNTSHRKRHRPPNSLPPDDAPIDSLCQRNSPKGTGCPPWPTRTITSTLRRASSLRRPCKPRI